jgi:hypothetical protein
VKNTLVALAAIAALTCLCGQTHAESHTGLMAPYLVAYPRADLAAGSAEDALAFDLADTPALATGGETLALNGAWMDVSGAEPPKKSYWPVFYSLLIPGAGELSLGYTWRGLTLVAIEAVAWVGYGINRSQGLDQREQFEAFADANWDWDEWILKHNATAQYVQDNPGFQAEDMTFPILDEYGRTDWAASKMYPGYHTTAFKATDKQNYYENIGKYEWFISGWKDWDGAMGTDLRTEYRNMRNSSDDNLHTANRFLWLSVGARLFSFVETIILVNRDHNKKVDEASKVGYRLNARSTSLYSGEVAFEVNF